jgi:A/G-specific adenine glycosylase
MATPRFATRLLRWFDQHRRDLPWRHTRDPWAIWVSEVMLQQTRVEAVRASYTQFVASYPSPAAWARVDDDELHAAWRGLGYYRRARLLRDGARAVLERHRGRIPADPEALARLPGIGSYTRGAVASIAFGLPEPAVDGNVERVTARHRALRANVKHAATRATIHAIVTGWLDRDRAGDFNQAMMELGAIVCTPVAPACGHCPVAADCEARRRGLTAELPVRPPRRAAVDVDAHAVVLATRGGIAGHRVPAGEPNAGQIDRPGGGLLRTLDVADLPRTLRDRFGLQVALHGELARVRHAITHHRITLHAHAATGRVGGSIAIYGPGDPAVPWTTPARKVFRKLFAGVDAPGGAASAALRPTRAGSKGAS